LTIQIMIEICTRSLVVQTIYSVYTIYTFIHINNVQKFSALFNNSVGKCCLHSFYSIFSIYFHCSASIPYRGQKRTDYTRNSREHSLPRVKVPGNFRSWERRFPLGTFAPRSENTGERKVLIPG